MGIKTHKCYFCDAMFYTTGGRYKHLHVKHGMPRGMKGTRSNFIVNFLGTPPT
jgi:hypothetical protein